MFVEQLSGRRISQGRAIERAAVALDDADHKMHAVLARGFAYARRLGSGKIDGAVVVAPELFAALRASTAEPRSEVQPFRIAADERLGENDEAGPSPRRIARQFGEFLQGSRRVEQFWSGLNNCGLDHGHG